MRHFIISFIFILISVSSIGQFDILWDDDPGVTYNGQTVTILKDYAGFDVYMHCQNNSSSAQDIKFRRVVLSSNDTLFNDQFCDNNLCYSCFGMTGLHSTKPATAWRLMFNERDFLFL